SHGSKEKSPLVGIGRGVKLVESVSVSLSAVERRARFSVLSSALRRAGGVVKIPPSSSGERAGGGLTFGAGVRVLRSPDVVAIVIALSDLIGYQMGYFGRASARGWRMA